MKLFNKIFRTNKIKVQFIDNLTGKTFANSEMQPDQLPESFAIPTTMHIQGNEWTVEEAIPEESAQFIKTGRLTLKLRKVEYVKTKDLLFTLPTISNELPTTTNSSPYNDFDTQIREDDWRQNEFLNIASFPLIDIEVAKIKEVWENDGQQQGENFTVFTKCHVRNTIGDPNLSIDFSELQKILNSRKIGSLKINSEFVTDGFSIKTEHTTFYGILNGNTVTQLGICKWNDYTSSEILKLTGQFDLVFISWYRCDIIKDHGS